MGDNYQAIYDAVRSRVHSVDVAQAIRDAIGFVDFSHNGLMVQTAFQEAAGIIRDEWTRPCVLHRPALSRDGNMWCALLGPDLMAGVAGFGETPEKAMAAFDEAFRTEKGA